jgi:hypothetical protein
VSVPASCVVFVAVSGKAFLFKSEATLDKITLWSCPRALDGPGGAATSLFAGPRSGRRALRHPC